MTEMQRASKDDLPDCHATFDETLEQIEYADEMGFHTAWITEHHFLPTFALSAASDLVLAAASRRTKRIRLGTGVVILPYHNPIHVAERMAALDLLSHGRLEFGTGRGGVFEQTGHGIDPRETRSMWEESLDCVEHIWDNYPSEITWEGKHWQIPARNIVPNTYNNRIPSMWLACAQPGTFDLAAERGLGVLSFVPNPIASTKPQIDAYREKVNTLAATGKRVNNRWASFAFANCSSDGAASRALTSEALKVFFGPGRPYAAAASEVARNLVKQWGGEIPDDLKIHLGLVEEPVGAEAADAKAGGNTGSSLGSIARASETQAGAIWDRLDGETLANEGVTIAGTPEQCIEGLKLFQAAGVDEVTILAQTETYTHAQTMETIRLFGEKVIPHFHNQAA